VATHLSGYVLAAPDEVLSTDDGGSHWRISLQGHGDVLGLGAQDATHARALGGTPATGTWRTEDAGRRWEFAPFAS
jgi:photosystem II stability/assembly factor-like uncharacterized protein